MKGCAPYIVDEIEYKNLNAEMNQFYDKSYKDVDEVKPLVIKEGQICVVFSEELECWCRAIVKSIMYCRDDYQIECFLVDYAKHIFVGTKDIRIAVEAFLQIPYRAKKCRLYRTKPVTLRVDFCENTAKIVPAKRWDSAAIQYFKNLLKVTTQMKANLCAVEDNTFDIFLYATKGDEKVCVNDDLVAKNFAHLENDDQENQTSLNAESLPAEPVNPVFPFRPMLCQDKTPTNPETGGNHVYWEQSYVQCIMCEVIVTTPYSFLRLFEHHNLLFCRLCHLVLDEVEILLSEATEQVHGLYVQMNKRIEKNLFFSVQVFTILDCYNKSVFAEEWEYSLHQIIAVGTHYNKHIARLIKEFMSDPYVVITAVEEASIYGNVQQVVQPCTNSEKTAVLLKILDFTPNNLQKVLIFTDSVNEAEMVHQVR
ncbi:hypothetical protein Q9233_006331 [Columba guinea]|nr:hypothetical protein Q9233_006331 [Columba guinea]